MPVETDGFLSAEQAVQALLTELERLKEEVEGYSLAKETLESTQVQVGDLAGKLSLLTERSRDIFEGLAKIGTTEILRQIEALRTVNTGLAQSSSQLTKDVQDSHVRVTGSYEKLNGSLAVLRESITKTDDKIEQARTKAASELAAVQRALERRLKRLTILVIIGIPFATALIVAAAVVFGQKLSERLQW